jgi:signal transduction histidine kinase
VNLSVEGEPRPLSPGAELSMYRIVQEALTNVLRHGGAATATLRVRYARDEVVVEVVDDGVGTSSGDSSGGHGLIGMRERVAVFGGRLETGALPDGGWRVLASLPLDRAEVAAG